MERKSFLLLTEMVLMIAVLALAAGICLRGVILAGNRAEENRTRDFAVRWSANAAEILSAGGGSMTYAASRLGGTVEGDTWTILFDHHGTPTDDGVLELRAVRNVDENPLLGTAEITVRQGDEILVTLTAAWQIPGEEAAP